MEKHKHSERKNNKNKSNQVKIWQVATAILGIFLLIIVAREQIVHKDINLDDYTLTQDLKGSTGSALNGNVVADNTVKYINENLLQGQASAKLNGIEESNGMYKIKLDIEGQEMESYISNDGKLLFPTAVDLTKKPETKQPPKAQETPTNLEKSDKPNVELFVMSHCPYGTQMEKGMLPVVKELGDKINFELKFVNYAMHPSQGEVEEQLNQYCIQKDFNDKFSTYLSKFLESGNGEEALSSVGLTQSDISKCVEETDKQFDVIKNLEDKSSWSSGRFPKFMIHDADNKKYGVGGSPTLIINGQKASAGRDAQSILNAVCGAFNDKPDECNTDMSSFGNPAPGFGFGTQGGSATSAGCGA